MNGIDQVNSMIKKLKIINFKSLKNISINCRKVNIFIGEPNTGKSNLLETLGFVSWIYTKDGIMKEYVRMKSTYELFNNFTVTSPIEIDINKFHFGIKHVKKNYEVTLPGKTYIVDGKGEYKETKTKETVMQKKVMNEVSVPREPETFPMNIELYKFLKNTDYKQESEKSEYLETPFGSNLFKVILTNDVVRKSVAELISEFDMILNINIFENNIEVLKESELGGFTAFNFDLLSDTIKSVIFYSTAILSNDNSVLIFEEPEEKNFPYYSKVLAELIAEDDSNQFFIVTHNPYFLQTLIEKTDMSQIRVNIAYLENHETKIKQLNQSQISKLLKSDPFFELELLIP
ncbi:MAG: hypothetical protein HeimC2_34230 [Candidatus Heimdallarchaeota archaeon LC_2]|nr:MAG: hypothetical protein HeimC2_34230 [Candidatus Heimdallarchaeota archaeon LC_2]